MDASTDDITTEPEEAAETDEAAIVNVPVQYEVEDAAVKVADAVSGWQNIDDGWYYYENGTVVTGWKNIDGVWYYFAEYSGWMYSDGIYEIDGKDYYFKTSGAMITGWYEEVTTWEYDDGTTGSYSNWYYADGSGALQDGWQKINGERYYFSPSYYMYSDGIYEIDGKDYYFKTSGAMITGWYEKVYTWGTYSYSYWYYADGNGVLQDGWQKINGKRYYFEPDSYRMYDSGIYDINGTCYCFTESGAMVTGWYQPYGSEWYYFEASGAAAQGWKKLNNKWYYFDEGHMYEGGSHKCDDGKYYLFKESGEWVNASGWYELKWEGSSYGTWYYLESDGTVRTSGWSKINGVWYYLDEFSGYMYKDGSFIIDENGSDVAYLFDKSGAWINKNGWYKYTETNWYDNSTTISISNWYYMTNGRLNTGMQTINGTQYYFSGDGVMYAGTYFIDDDGTRYFAADSGALSKPSAGWVKGTRSYIVNGKTKTFTQWYYFGANGAEYTGWLKAGSSWYYLDGSVAVTNGSYDVNGTIYVFGSNGVLCENKAGWIACQGTVDTTWYYVNAKGVAYTGWKSIGGKWYYFSAYTGYVYNDGVYYIDNAMYGFSSSGAMVTGWFKSSYSDRWYYFDSNGKGHNGWVKSGSTWYYTEDGRTYANGTYTINGKKCKFDANGKWLGYV